MAGPRKVQPQDCSVPTHEPPRSSTGKADRPVVRHPRKQRPGVAFISRPGSSTGTSRYNSKPLARNIAQTVHRPCEWGGCRESPGLSAVSGARNVVLCDITRHNVSSTENATEGIAKINAHNARGRSTLEDRHLVRCPAVSAIGGGQNSRLHATSRTDPGTLTPLGGNAGAARSKSGFARLRAWELVRNTLPRLPIGGFDHGKTTVYGVSERDATIRGPEIEAVVEESRIGTRLKLELPAPAAIFGLVNAIVGSFAGGEQVRFGSAYALHIPELKSLRAGDDGRSPGVTPVGSQRIRASRRAGPYHPVINRAHRKEALGCP